MTLEPKSGPIAFPSRIDVQYDLGNFAPVGTLGVSIEQPQISDQVLFVVTRQRRADRPGVRNIGIKGRLFHNDSKCPFSQAFAARWLRWGERPKRRGSSRLPPSRSTD